MNRQVGRLFTLEDAVDVAGGEPKWISYRLRKKLGRRW
jgi:hypothetical protein